MFSGGSEERCLQTVAGMKMSAGIHLAGEDREVGVAGEPHPLLRSNPSPKTQTSRFSCGCLDFVGCSLQPLRCLKVTEDNKHKHIYMHK